MRLKHKVAVVTGSSRGVGRRIAEVFAQEGASVVVTGRGDGSGEQASSIHRIAAEISRAGGEAIALPCDLTREEEVNSLIRKTLERYGRIDILVNNAVARFATKLIDSTAEELEWIWRVNVIGTFLMSKYVLPCMKEQGSGNIINVITGRSLQASSVLSGFLASYQMTKMALTIFSIRWAQEVREFGIAVNAFNPGAIATESAVIIKDRLARVYGIALSEAEDPRDPVEVCDEPVLYLATQTVETFTGQVVDRVDYAKTWGPR